MSCCDNPQPRVLEKNGRLFCNSCRRYLDVRGVKQPPLLDSHAALEEPPDPPDEESSESGQEVSQ